MERKEDLLEKYRAVVKEQTDFVQNSAEDFDFSKDESWIKRDGIINGLQLRIQEFKKLEAASTAFDHAPVSRGDARTNVPADDEKQKQMRSFVDYCTTGDARLIHQQRADLASNGTTTGGYLVPTFVSANVLQDLVAQTSVRSMGAQVMEIVGNTNVPIMQDAVANFIVEAQSVTATDPTTAEAQLKPQLLICKTTYSWQLANRSVVSITDQLQKAFVRGIAKTESSKFLYGGGSNEPQGVIASGTTAVTTASATTFTLPELLQVHDSINPIYEKTGAWIMSPAAATIARSLESTGGFPVITPNLTGGFDQLYGRPVILDANMNPPTAALKPLAFISMADAYVIGEEVNLTVLSDPYSAAGTGEIRLFVYKFVDGRVAKAAASQVMLMHS